MASCRKKLRLSLEAPQQMQTHFDYCLVHAPCYARRPHPYDDFVPYVPFEKKHLYVKRLATVRLDKMLGMCVKILYHGTREECFDYKLRLCMNEQPRYRRYSV